MKSKLFNLVIVGLVLNCLVSSTFMGNVAKFVGNEITNNQQQQVINNIHSKITDIFTFIPN